MLIRPDLLLRLEALLVFLIALLCYEGLHGRWLLFVVLFLVPDLSLLGYGVDHNQRFAARLYNAAHCYAAPLALGLVGWKLRSVLSEQLAVLWIAHIAFDRLIGFGLKYAQAPHPTHLQTACYYRP